MKNNLIVLISVLSLSICCNKQDFADTIIYGGTIYTVDSTNSIVESVAVKDGIILKKGSYFCLPFQI